MRREAFREWLENNPDITSKTNAVNTRVYKVAKVEEKYLVDIDDVVVDDEATYELLMNLTPEDKQARLQNGIRKYYEFVRGTTFPTLKEYASYHRRR